MPRVPDFPRRVSVEVTNHCDQRCRLCPREAFTRPLGFMPRELFAKIAAECAAHDTVLWLHFLGEPLLHRELPDLVRDAKAAGVGQVGLSTNGVSLVGPLVDALLESGLDRLECSMDANEREAYAAMRGRDHFDRVVTNVRGFLRRKQELGRERPVTSVQFMRTPAVEAGLDALVDEWRPYLGERDFVMTIVPATFGGAIDEGAAAGAVPRGMCAWLTTALMVMQDGTVTMCGADWDAHHPLGNVATTSLYELWHGSEMTRRRSAHAASRFDEVGGCAGCEDWALADGSGYANALEEVDRRRGSGRGPS